MIADIENTHIDDDTSYLDEMLRYKNYLLLQGPVGPFFNFLTNQLQLMKKSVYKINFNGGDELFSKRELSISYTGALEDWDGWLEGVLQEKEIQAIILLGEWRKYHQIAQQITKKNGIAVYVFEEGYIRPNYITLEEHGVNGNSRMPRSCEYYQKLEKIKEPKPIGQTFGRAAVYAIAYYIAAYIMQWKYASYIHHRPLNPLTEGWAWIVSGWRKLYYSIKERYTLKLLQSKAYFKKYYFVPLQVHVDSQIIFQSDYDSVEEFITEVVDSFIKNSTNDKYLVIKHHPMDRGYKNYKKLIEELASKYKVDGRIIYIQDGHLPSLLEGAIGSVMINSTVGLSSLFHNTPVKLNGKAVFDVDGLVFPGTLDEFWRDSGIVNMDLFNKLKYKLVRKTQINASFYLPKSYKNIFPQTRDVQ